MLGASMQVRIHEYLFDLPDPYQEGHQLSLAEAQALNKLRAENIRNNMAKVIDEARAKLEPGQLLPSDEFAALRAQIDLYASNYQFQLRHVARRNPDLLAEQTHTLAREIVRAARARAGDALDGPAFEAEVAMLAATHEVQVKAQERLALLAIVSGDAVEDLL